MDHQEMFPQKAAPVIVMAFREAIFLSVQSHSDVPFCQKMTSIVGFMLFDLGMYQGRKSSLTYRVFSFKVQNGLASVQYSSVPQSPFCLESSFSSVRCTEAKNLHSVHSVQFTNSSDPGRYTYKCEITAVVTHPPVKWNAIEFPFATGIPFSYHAKLP